jgi:dihydroneopterin aldolase
MEANKYVKMDDSIDYTEEDYAEIHRLIAEGKEEEAKKLIETISKRIHEAMFITEEEAKKIKPSE